MTNSVGRLVEDVLDIDRRRTVDVERRGRRFT